MSRITFTEPLHVPVLFIIFNRPNTTKLVFEAIRQARPPRLYIAADGPRSNVKTDAMMCSETRAIALQVDWNCEVKTLFREQNLGCRNAMPAAISWFFEQENEGIILEDDCLPSQSFFFYCQELLGRYRHDTRIMHVGGNNFLNGWQKDHEYSYYFSRSGHIWGWATWRRAWKTYDLEMRYFDSAKRKGYFDDFFLNPLEKMYRLRKWHQVAAREIDTWDYQWDFARYINSGLAIVPKKNLVENIGFGEMATNTKISYDFIAQLKAQEIELPLRHPPFMVRDVQSDRRYFNILMKGLVVSKLKL